MKLNEDYLNNMRELLGNEFNDYLASLDLPKYNGFHINNNKISKAEVKELLQHEFSEVPWYDQGFYYDSEQYRLSKDSYYSAGLYYLQEPSAMVAASVLPIEKGDIVVDCCSAPGGKATQILNKLDGTGLLICNDISISRCQGLLKNVELTGYKNAIVCSDNLDKLSLLLANKVDKIIIDAPCSGEGMFRKDSGLISSYSSDSNNLYASKQKQIVSKALKMLKPSGMIVYSTCTFSPKENEEIIQYMLELQPELEMVEIEKYPGFENGLNGLEEAKRLYPHKIKGEGHFVALMQKKGARSSNTILASISNYQLPFFENISKDFFQGNVIRINDKLILSNTYELDLTSLRILRDGLLLGTEVHDKFQPANSLALALKSTEFNQVVNFAHDDIRVIKYLKGETLLVQEYDYQGWVLICVNNFPLGFGIMSNKQIKNKYERSWIYN